MDRLSVLSSAFLDAEDVDPELSMVIGSCGVLEGPAPTVEEVRRLVADRLELAPRYTQRVRHAPLDVRTPGWVEDAHFDVERHVLRRAVPTPGGDRELTELFGELMSERMDRSHPLWDVVVVDGLESGRWALVCRVHHALADGVSGTELLRMVYDRVGPDAPQRSVGLRPAGSRTAPLTSALRAVRGAVALGGALVPVHGRAVTGPVRSGRRYAWRRVPTESVRELREALGVTLNDVALASVAGGFRTLLEHRGVEPHPHALRSLVPVSAWSGRSARAPGHLAPDNRVTLVLAELPVDVAHPVQRVMAVHERIGRLRRSGEPEAGVWAQRLVATVPRAVLGRVSRLLLRVPQHVVATVTTNVPGPAVPLACLGRRVEHLLPYVPIADQVRVGLAMFSYCGELTFGISADRDVDDLEVLADGVEAAWWSLAGTKVPDRDDG